MNESDAHHPILTLLRIVLVVIFPVVLILTAVRLVATETFLRLEYNRPGFPADRYGFTKDDRLTYGPYGVRYIVQNQDISTLADLEYGGEPLFRAKELRHMEDVQTVTRVAFRIHTIASLVFVAGVAALAWRRDRRWALRQSLAGGGIFTLAAIFTLVVLVFVSWDFFFDNFHTIFFEGDSWMFYTSDSLIRLYPEQFWFDASLVIGGLTIGGSLAAILGVWWWEQRVIPPPATPNQNGATADPVISHTED